MATLVFAKQFLDDFAGLQPPVRQKVRELPDKFEDATHTGVHLEKLTKAVDDRIRTVRIDQFWRGVVVRLGEGRYALLRVMAHDDANVWAIRQRFGVNPVTGIVEVLDVPTVADHVDAVTATAPEEVPGLFAERRDRDFTTVGIDEALIPVLRRLTSEDELYAVAHYLPDAQADAVLLLAEGKSTDEIWAALQADYQVKDTPVDPEDIDTALDRAASKSGFVVTTNDTELLDLLSGDFEAWRTFLHPTQRDLAYKPVYNGPVRVTGGAGTGKTIVAIHRARHLARELAGRRDTTSRVLVATYTKSLAENLERTLRTFCTPDEHRRLHVGTVDALAHQTLTAAGGARLRPVAEDDLRELAESAATMAGLDEHGLDGRFLIAEWEQIILARRIHTLPEYAQTPRPNRGSRLTRTARKTVWSAVEHLTADLVRRGQATFLQFADLAAETLAARSTPPFAHAVIDEAQDLHPAQWRLLRAAVPPGPNDLFIVGDAHQRIYDYRVSLSGLGIETRGRSRRLKINYRTSQQILSWALPIITGEVIDDLDGEAEPQTGYRSAFDGPPPTLVRFTTPAEEAGYVAEQIRDWIKDGVNPSAIGVTARTRRHLKPVQDALGEAGVDWADVGSEPKKPSVRVATMHSAKGLEFARLAVVAVNADTIPLPVAVTAVQVDPTQHDLDLQRERCLLYVACTRARDELVVTGSGPPSPLIRTVQTA
ncbi:MAG: UvrD-helicase domain-containing protein [Actinomycetota bacterium]